MFPLQENYGTDSIFFFHRQVNKNEENISHYLHDSAMISWLNEAS